MPQMASLWWEILFLMFIMCFMIMNMIIYYNKMVLPKKEDNLFKKISQLNWKW